MTAMSTVEVFLTICSSCKTFKGNRRCIFTVALKGHDQLRTRALVCRGFKEVHLYVSLTFLMIPKTESVIIPYRHNHEEIAVNGLTREDLTMSN